MAFLGMLVPSSTSREFDGIGLAGLSNGFWRECRYERYFSPRDARGGSCPANIDLFDNGGSILFSYGRSKHSRAMWRGWNDLVVPALQIAVLGVSGFREARRSSLTFGFVGLKKESRDSNTQKRPDNLRCNEGQD